MVKQEIKPNFTLFRNKLYEKAEINLFIYYYTLVPYNCQGFFFYQTRINYLFFLLINGFLEKSWKFQNYAILQNRFYNG